MINTNLNYHTLPLGKGAPEIVDCVVEISKDSNVKYEYDEDLNVFRLDRCLISSMSYPASYGFIPSTLADDGDALDILIWNSMPLMTGTIVQVKVIGALDMEDGGKKDYKLLGVPVFNPNTYNDISDIDSMFLKVTKNFFQHYKELEEKEVVLGDWKDKEFAVELVKESHQAFLNNH
jgi:inorganic pyrophosphatase